MEREKLCDGVKHIAWGYLLLYFNINLGTLNILPNWLGYILILGALPVISEAEKSAKLLRPLGILLALWEGVQWVSFFFGGTFDGYALEVIVAVVSLYFHFQLLTNLANVAAKYGCPEKDRILKLRTVRTVIATAIMLPIPWEEYMAGLAVTAIVGMIVTIWICSVLFSLRRSLMPFEPRQSY